MYLHFYLLASTVDKLTSLQVLTHPSTPFPMTSSIDLDKSSGGSILRLCSATACKKKIFLILDSLKLTPLTGANLDPNGLIASHDFRLDYQQLPHCKTAASDAQHECFIQTVSKNKSRPCLYTNEDTDDSQTYSSCPLTNPPELPAILPPIDTSAPLFTAPMSTPQDASIPSSQPPTGPSSLFYSYLWFTFSVHEI